MFTKNYYVTPFFIETVLLIGVIVLRNKLLIPVHMTYALIVVIGLLTLKTFFGLIGRMSAVKLLAFSRPLTYSLKNAAPDLKNVFIGKGFVWENMHVQRLFELSKMRSMKKFYNTRATGGNPSIHGVGVKDEKSITLPTSSLSLHTAIIGGTGSGKTRLIESMVTQAVLRNEPVIVIDPKGDAELVDRIYDTCKKYAREDDFQFFSLSHPKHSQSYNPLESFSKSSDIASRITSLIDVKGDSFYREFAWNLINSVVQGLLAMNMAITFKAIYRFALHDLKPLHQELGKRLKSLNEKEEYMKPSIQEAINNIEIILSYGDDHLNKLKANLVPIFSSLTSGEIGELLNQKPTDISWQKVVHKKKVVYFYLGSMIDQALAGFIGKMALQDLLYYLGTIYSYQESKKRVPINIFVDEFYNVMFPGYVDLLNKSRGAGARVTIGMQTSKDIEAVSDEKVAGQILANTNTKICLRIPEPSIAELFEKLFPIVSIDDGMDTMSYNPDVSDNGEAFGTSAGIRRMGKDMPLVDKSYITSLPIGQAFMYTQGEQPYKLRLPMIRDNIDHSFMRRVLNDVVRGV